ncbi:MoxR family ATPase [Vibrio sp. Isolate33]|uniref:AAA family ATPase n=1 Tax=unclassified Vibrio TaxID=2614977 RepID=UPI00159E4574|nr:MoxR family ATPase [Vibrio sp. Scap24]MCG9545342.1 MoxR family ATPase [Vibrio sp. Isolate33]NVN83101.1 MoxR family ATPase [Vibrio sp. Scap16]QLE91741.1 MoxR family ATPase [Vibrio sp. Scap24]
MSVQKNHFITLQEKINLRVLGQEKSVEQLVIALLANGHVLLQGLPGLAKTRSVSVMASQLDSDLNRIQFTPDMLPADITGSEVYESNTQSLTFKKGPVFTHLLLADEINRAPAKVQSALLEAMAEKQVSIAGETHKLPELFMVLATQNPVEQEGTYPLPEAQMDRFLMQILIDYPSKDAEKNMLKLLRIENQGSTSSKPLMTIEQVLEARRHIDKIHVAEQVDQYIVDLIDATRYPDKYDEQLSQWIELGASPRATIALDKCSRAHAWLNGQDYVTPDNVRAVAHSVFRHRLVLTFTSQNQGVDAEQVIDKLLNSVAFS